VSLVIHRLQQVSSTQDEARRLVESGEGKAGHVIVADEQREGRGRFGRAWLSAVGGLYATFIVARHELIPLLSGIAVLRAVARFGVDAIEGTAVNVDAEGRLLVETASGVRAISSGECTHLRS